MFKKAFFIAVAFVVLKTIIKIILNPNSVWGIFEQGAWEGIGVYLIVFFIVFISSALIIYVYERASKSKGSH